MSLIQTIKTRNYTDLINEGRRVSVTGVLGAGIDQTILDIALDRFFILTGYCLSSNSTSPVLVSISLKPVSGASIEVVQGYVGGGMVISRDLSFGNWLYGDLGYQLAMSATGTVAYTIDGRLSSSPKPLGYIERIGTKNHANPYFGLESGADRGQSEV